MCPLCYESSARFREEGKLPEATDRDAVLPVARMTRGLRIKRGLPVIGLILITAYATVLLYQAVAPRQWLQDDQPGVLVGVTANDDPDIGDIAAVTAPFATATVAPFGTDLNDVFISVKTTRHYHYSRLPAILNTWFQLAKNQTWFFTDKDDPVFQTKTNGHMINTKCSSSHNRKALCCKMSVEFDKFLESGKKWFCHFDDDNYVNVPRLVKLLEDYDPREDWYLGKPSIRAPLEILNREGPPPSKKSLKIRFWFATGGAGFCLSRALALKMMPVASGGKFISIGDKIRLPDDVTMGYIIEHLLKKPLTVVEQFHSHLEPMKFLRKETFHDQISFSFSKNSKDEWNVVKIDGFDLKYDPKRFRSIHCHLFPEFSYCPPR